MSNKTIFLLFLLPVMTLLSACANVTRTSQIDEKVAVGCKTNLGAYSLPRQEMSITLTPRTGGKKGHDIAVDVEAGMMPDNNHVYCLDFLYSGLGKNTVGIDRTNAGLLTKIFTKFDSQSQDIAKEVIDSAANLAAFNKAQGLSDGSSGLRAGAPQIRASDNRIITFDPFNHWQAKIVTEELAAYGYCIYFDNLGDPRIPDWWPGLCGRTTYGKDNISLSLSENYFANEKKMAKKAARYGILYRPEISHRIKILTKKDPGNRAERWKLAGTEFVKLPNRAPIFALDIKRGTFTTTETAVSFKDGILTDIRIEKPSELKVVTDVSVYAVDAVLGIPAQALKIFQTDVDNRILLINSNKELINTLAQLDRKVLLDQAIKEGKLGVNAQLVPFDQRSLSNSLVRSSGQNCLDDSQFLLDPAGYETCREIIQGGQ